MDERRGGPPGGPTYHFTPASEGAAATVVEAVSFVTGRDPLAVTPLADVLDPEALDALISRGDGVTVDFEIEGVDVRVTGDGHVAVSDPRSSGEHRGRLGDASNVLVRAADREDEVCRDLLARETPDGANVLGVAFSPPLEDRLDTWGSATPGSTSDAAVIAVGDFVRSASAGGTVPSPHWGSIPLESVDRPEDLDDLGDRIEERLASWAGNDARTVVCFDSVTALLRHVDRERAHRFLRSQTERVRAADAVAHYHLDASDPDRSAMTDLADLFDVVAEVDERGEWHIRR